jgi:hypothetical protein
MALDNFAPLRTGPLNQALVEDTAAAIRRACAQQAEHLDRRAAQGFVRRCHGDLHLRNIVCLDGQPTPFDALEFDPGLATGDVYYDLAFLLMDLDHRGLRAHACRLLNRYVMDTNDVEGLAALPLFLAVRALIRAKVAILAATTQPRQDADESLGEARAYLDLVAAYLPAAPAQMVAIGGLSGTGKSQVAQALAPSLRPSPGALVIRSDVIRKRLHGVSETTRLPEIAYASAETKRVYGAMNDMAERCLRAGYSCILDAVFARREERDSAAAFAAVAGRRFTGVWLETDLETRTRRISGREHDASDADIVVAQRQDAYALGDIAWRHIDAMRDIDHTVGLVLKRLDFPA